MVGVIQQKRENVALEHLPEVHFLLVGGGVKILEQPVVDEITCLVEFLNYSVAIPVGVYGVMGNGIDIFFPAFIDGGQLYKRLFVIVCENIAQALVGSLV